MAMSSVDAAPCTASQTIPSDSKRRESSVPVLRRATRQSVAAVRARQPSASSLVQQKVHSAIDSAERTPADLLRSPAPQLSFRARAVATAAAAARGETDRSVSRYRSDAAVVSFAETPSASLSTASTTFCYSNNFMPGVHFYTFLASKDSSSSVSASDGISNTQGSHSSGPLTIAPPPLGADHNAISSTAKVRNSSALRMWIPDTIVYGETGRAVRLYSDEEGFVQRSTEVSDKLVLERLVDTFDADDLDPIVVCKEPTTASTTRHSASDTSSFAYQGNLLRLLSPGELKTVLSNVVSTRSSKSFALQKFVRCNASKAFVVRAVHEAGKPPYAWMINNTTPLVAPTPTVSQVLLSLGQDANVIAPLSSAATVPSRSGSVVASVSTSASAGSAPTETTSGEEPNDTSGPAATNANAVIPLVNRFCTSVQVDKACTFIKLGERGCTTVSELNQRIVKYIEHRLQVQLQTLVADFVKDTGGRWWLLQVKHFRVRNTFNPAKSHYSLPRRLRMQYLGYRDSSIVEEMTESDDEHERERRVAQVAAQHTQRQVHKLSQCKCCLAAYPKAELSFKMTLKMINEMLVRIRSRLPPEKVYTFLAAALARESPDPSLAYESWSVCSFCYAIYERDQHLQKVEAKFAQVLGIPDPGLVPAGLGRLDERAVIIDPNAPSTVIPSQLTLCRLLLVINGIYDIPPELYDAERTPLMPYEEGQSHLYETVTSRLYLRISALGYTECIPVDPTDIEVSHEKAPRGTRRRRSSAASISDDSDSDDDDDSKQRSAKKRGSGRRNYWLPINLIRTLHFFAPRTPLHAKLKETSGLMPFLNEDNSISIQFIRATEPPLQDPTPVTQSLVERGRTRRTALQPQPHEPLKGLKPEAAKPMYAPVVSNHSVQLGATKIRMAQFRSAYVTKLDFYACMALTGEMFNIKGNIGLERVRYVDSKLLTSRYRMRIYNGVYIPDASYVPSDPLTSEWMDCLRAAVAPSSPKSKAEPRTPHSAATLSRSRSRQSTGEMTQRSTSTTSVSADGEDMDEELENMIDDASGPRRSVPSSQHVAIKAVKRWPMVMATGNVREGIVATLAAPLPSQPTRQDIMPTRKIASQFESRMSMLMTKPILSPRETPDVRFGRGEQLESPLTVQKLMLWSLVIQLNHVHHLQSRERPFCRWECYYELLGQRRSAVERPNCIAAHSPSKRPESSTDGGEKPTLAKTREVAFNNRHTFFFSATAAMLAAHWRSNPKVTFQLRNDIYSSTRSRSVGEFFCALDVSAGVSSKRYDTTLDIIATPDAPEVTPREAALLSRSPPYLSLSVQLSQLALDPREVVSKGDFVVVGATKEGIEVLKKIT